MPHQVDNQKCTREIKSSLGAVYALNYEVYLDVAFNLFALIPIDIMHNLVILSRKYYSINGAVNYRVRG